MLKPNLINRMRVVIKGYDASVVDSVTKHFTNVLEKNGLEFSGPVPLPCKTKRFIVLKSPHVNKDARQTFEILNVHRIIELPESKNAVMTLSGIKAIHPCAKVKIKIIGNKLSPEGGAA
jgi:small subunit ribosomal protein S10